MIIFDLAFYLLEIEITHARTALFVRKCLQLEA